MKCPYCGHPEDRVIETRSAREGEAIRRRRECMECGRRFTTFEEIEERFPVVVKKDGRREPFQRGKVLNSMAVACRKRPVPTAVLTAAAQEVEAQLLDSHLSEIPSSRIGELVLDRLEELDPVAYIRFASVYREFDDPEEFHAFVGSLRRKKRRPVVADSITH
ncbi:MAG: Transcriptional repressor NrdR [Fimbriimonadales bacterium]|nr:MAG: transcriptional repressor NrdR [Armatimonadota bacterium]MBV6504249.1 Transcriptional repressor NrdR [Fimbriimonadales bacterium]MCE7900765.1 transcriptional repressor NrdR [Armatimonadetes bacterium ATM1]MDL1929288.1 transcriptional repressor NrdR [Fimbriimonadia bacterium ATM]MBC6969227.1 transcriptional repressor NrdR [Armatimonadota bacterium]